VGRRHDAIVAAVDEQHGPPDVADVEAPGRGEGEVVVDQPLGAAGVAPRRVGT
jgi:hypothetical protein